VWARPVPTVAGCPASIEIHRLAALARKQDSCLVCFCAPKACHADSIKRAIAAINRE
jgi:hypothetical protein